MRVLNSLQTKLTASFIVLVLVVSGLAFVLTLREARQALEEVTQTELLVLASVVASQLSGADADSMAALRPGDEESASFIRIRDVLRRIRSSHSDIKYLYTMKRTADGVFFVVDADYGNAEDPGGKIGQKYDETTANLLRGFEEPSVDDQITTDEWGSFLSGYAPVRDSRGTVVGLLGVDMASDRVLEKQAFLGATVYAVMAVGILLSGVFILVFSKTIIRDIRKLNRTANAISMGHMDVEMDVARKDEIGELAESFGRMVASLKIMMAAEREA